jgi:ribonuclease VapC
VIIDSSAVVAILHREAGYESLLDTVMAAPRVRIGAPTAAETGIVLTARHGVAGRTLLSRFLQEVGAEIVPFTDVHWSAAVSAYSRFGKGRHPAGLNFGDCLTYAVAAVAAEPLLCVGDDFARTDLVLAKS